MVQDNRVQILRCLLESGEPLTGLAVADRTQIHHATVVNQLQHLREEGVVLYHNRRFHVQAYLQNPAFVNSFWIAFAPYIKTIQERSDLSQAQNGDYVFSNFIALLELFKTKVSELQTQAHRLKERRQ